MKPLALILLLFAGAPGVTAPAAEAPPRLVAVTGGTVLTVTRGTIEGGTVLVRGGRIAAVGTDVVVPPEARVIDARGRFVMPGIVDAHSHLALGGDINEATSPVTPQLRMADAVVVDDPAVFRALAGGVTAAKLMHGSANVIGGVNVTVKLKWRRPLAEMRVEGVRPQIKMALGENPMMTYGKKGQAPSTRPGEIALARQAFLEAREYVEERGEHEAKRAKGEGAAPFRVDLEKETLGEVLAGRIAVDCHAYSAQEMVAMMRLADELKLPLRAFSHAFEAYEVRDEIARRGISVLTHTDWWGYKWEAYDAIPYLAGMLQASGVNTAIVSDSDDVVRRLNREAAKVVRYSGLSPDEALAMITINPARALEIDSRTGSLEVDKDADLAIFDRHPLDGLSKVVLTMVEGEVMFDAERAEEGVLR